MGATRSVSAAFPELTEQAARALERDLVAAARGATGNTTVSSVLRSPMEGTWYRTETVSVELDDGTRVRFFLKDFATYARPKSRMEQRRERERFFYREVFPHGELGLPAFVADVWDGAKWLFLELVDAVPLAWCDLEVWHEAAGWLGRFQSAVAPRFDSLAASGRFTAHSRDYFEGTARRAAAGAAAYGDAAARSVEAAVPEYLDRVEVLLAHPQTLVHGAFRPSQILVAGEAQPRRICPTDWEIAAAGSCLYDLATLADGFSGTDLGEFFDHYAEEAAWPGAASVGRRDLAAAARACRMHRTMKWISHAARRDMPPDTVRALVEGLRDAPGDVR